MALFLPKHDQRMGMRVAPFTTTINDLLATLDCSALAVLLSKRRMLASTKGHSKSSVKMEVKTTAFKQIPVNQRQKEWLGCLILTIRGKLSFPYRVGIRSGCFWNAGDHLGHLLVLSYPVVKV